MKKTQRGKISLAEVAKEAGVSKMTASRVLRKASGFSEVTREKVMRAVDQLGYVPNRIAAAFGSEGTSTIVGISVPFLSTDLFGAVLDSTNDALAKHGYQMMVGTHENSAKTEEIWVQNMLSWRPAGLILSAPRHSKATRELLKTQGLPVAEIWNLNTSPIDLSVGFNHFDSGKEMGQYVLSKGYSRIAYVGADAFAPGLGAVRRKGFADALKSAGLEFVCDEILNDRSSYYAGFYGTETVLNRNPDIDCIYYQDDEMAVGGYFYCRSAGLAVPKDVAIAGWGSIDITSVLPQRLTTTIVSTQALGKSAADALIARIRGEQIDDVIITATRLAPGTTV